MKRDAAASDDAPAASANPLPMLSPELLQSILTVRRERPGLRQSRRYSSFDWQDVTETPGTGAASCRAHHASEIRPLLLQRGRASHVRDRLIACHLGPPPRLALHVNEAKPLRSPALGEQRVSLRRQRSRWNESRLETGDCLSLDCWAHTMRKALKIARSTPLCRKMRIAAIRDFPPTLFSGH